MGDRSSEKRLCASGRALEKDVPTCKRGHEHELDSAITRGDVDPGRSIRIATGVTLGAGPCHRVATASSSMNLRLAASYGKGSGSGPSKQAKQKRSYGSSSAASTPRIDR